MNAKKILVPSLVALIALVAIATRAATVTIPSTFTAGTTASASQVNANFAAVANAIQGLKIVCVTRFMPDSASVVVPAGSHLSAGVTALCNANETAVAPILFGISGLTGPNGPAQGVGAYIDQVYPADPNANGGLQGYSIWFYNPNTTTDAGVKGGVICCNIQ
jgi:hypothetical protein